MARRRGGVFPCRLLLITSKQAFSDIPRIIRNPTLAASSCYTKCWVSETSTTLNFNVASLLLKPNSKQSVFCQNLSSCIHLARKASPPFSASVPLFAERRHCSSTPGKPVAPLGLSLPQTLPSGAPSGAAITIVIRPRSKCGENGWLPPLATSVALTLTTNERLVVSWPTYFPEHPVSRLAPHTLSVTEQLWLSSVASTTPTLAALCINHFTPPSSSTWQHRFALVLKISTSHS